jgi:hypothetical protein
VVKLDFWAVKGSLLARAPVDVTVRVRGALEIYYLPMALQRNTIQNSELRGIFAILESILELVFVRFQVVLVSLKTGCDFRLRHEF